MDNEEELTPDENEDIPHIHLRAWFAYIKEHEDRIYVRSRMSGTWESVPLSSVPPVEWGCYLVDWLERGHVPVYVKDENDPLQGITQGG